MVRALCGEQLKQKTKDFMLIFGLNETIDQLTIANSVHWDSHVLRRGWS